MATEAVTKSEQTQETLALAREHAYTVKGIEFFKGHDGQIGLNATLYRANSKIATVHYDARGGEYEWDFIDCKEEGDLKALLQKISPVKLEQSLITEYEFTLEMCPDFMIDMLVGEAETEKRYKRMCKTRTLVILNDSKEGQCLSFNRIYNNEMRLCLQEKYPNGEIKEIINERY